MDQITMLHGSGGRATGRLIEEVFLEAFGDGGGAPLEDAALVKGSDRLAVTTDSFVVTPLFYPGGDIGRLAVCGTVNDLLMRGSLPRYITAGFILQEGLAVETVAQVAESMARACTEAGVSIVCGDTKVVEAGSVPAFGGEISSGSMFINTTGIGFVPEGVAISAAGARPGDRIMVSGTMGDHHATILSRRLEVENEIISDNAPLVAMVSKLRKPGVHSLRDVTRGGLATVLCELAEASGNTFHIHLESVPVSAAVRDFAGILGLDPLYMGNEGKLVAIVAPEAAEEVLRDMQSSPYGKDAAIIGEVSVVEEHGPGVLASTAIGGIRRLSVLEDEGLPRIC